MKKNIIYLVFALLLSAGGLQANSFGPYAGCLTTADAVGFGVGYLGGFICYGEDVSSVFGNISYGFSSYTDGRLIIGLADPDFNNDDPTLLVGGDIKYEIMDYNDKEIKYPFDAAAGLFIESASYSSYRTFQLGGYGIGSLPYVLKSGKQLIPYIRINFRWERLTAKGDSDDSDSNYRVGLNFGTMFELLKEVNLFGEIQLDGNFGILAGINFRAL